jgi:YD repeat-containing protein
VTDTRTYNAFGELETYAAWVTGAATPLLATSFVRDALGRIVEKTETVGSETDVYTYGYDQAGRLETVTRNGTHTVTYGYDANGNRLTRAVNGAVVETGVYDAQDRVETYAGRTFT